MIETTIAKPGTDEREIVVVATCTVGHTQTFRWRGFAVEWVQTWAGLLDGTSPLYVHPPGDSPESVIGRCCWSPDAGLTVCGARVRCEVTPSAPRNAP